MLAFCQVHNIQMCSCVFVNICTACVFDAEITLVDIVFTYFRLDKLTDSCKSAPCGCIIIIVIISVLLALFIIIIILKGTKHQATFQK